MVFLLTIWFIRLFWNDATIKDNDIVYIVNYGINKAVYLTDALDNTQIIIWNPESKEVTNIRAGIIFENQ